MGSAGQFCCSQLWTGWPGWDLAVVVQLFSTPLILLLLGPDSEPRHVPLTAIVEAQEDKPHFQVFSKLLVGPPSLWPTNIPSARASHITKLKAKRQENRFLLFNGTNCKVRWQRIWIWEDWRIEPMNAVYDSTYHIPGTVLGAKETVLIMIEAGLLELTVKNWSLNIYPHRLHCSLLRL